MYRPKDDEDYLKWVEDNQDGFILQNDHRGTIAAYPKLHLATCGSATSPK